MHLAFGITYKMYEALIREKERRKLYTLPDTVRVLLSEKLREDEELTKERREAWGWEPQTQTQVVVVEAPATSQVAHLSRYILSSTK